MVQISFTRNLLSVWRNWSIICHFQQKKWLIAVNKKIKVRKQQIHSHSHHQLYKLPKANLIKKKCAKYFHINTNFSTLINYKTIEITKMKVAVNIILSQFVVTFVCGMRFTLFFFSLNLHTQKKLNFLTIKNFISFVADLFSFFHKIFKGK